MASHKTEDKAKTPEIKKTPGKQELSSGELDKVVGGMKKNVTVGKSRPGIIGDPCAGGE